MRMQKSPGSHSNRLSRIPRAAVSDVSPLEQFEIIFQLSAFRLILTTEEGHMGRKTAAAERGGQRQQTAQHMSVAGFEAELSS